MDGGGEGVVSLSLSRSGNPLVVLMHGNTLGILELVDDALNLKNKHDMGNLMSKLISE